MTLRSKQLHWNRNTFRQAMNIAHTHFIKIKIAGKLDTMKDWVFRKHI